VGTDDDDDDPDLADPAESSELDLVLLLCDLLRLLSRATWLFSCRRSFVCGCRADDEPEPALEEGPERCLAIRRSMLRPRFCGTSASLSDTSLPPLLAASSVKSWRLLESRNIWLFRPNGAPKLLN
jgi:hypothetical protein